MAKICSAYFSASGSWLCPAGVTRVFVLAQGGGAGGSGGRNATFYTANCGMGTTPYMRACNVVPNTTYTITIGAGGNGGAPVTSATQNGLAGGNTTFGALLTFTGAPASSTTKTNTIMGAVSTAGASGTGVGDNKRSSGYVVSDAGALTLVSNYAAGYVGAPGYAGSAGGTRGSASATTGGNGGNATGFGAGGGSGGSGATSGGSGGNGSGGQLWVIWVE